MINQPIYLTDRELEAITGRRRSSAQIRWLRSNGFLCIRRGDGRPLVSRSHFEAVMGGILPAPCLDYPEPDFEALR
ncbi:DUF4224 domain-containing protein [Thioalkalivibrio sp. XN8]|nr:DUF4224 domain-containing protein [Thioalkalivibrio sp. XN8]